MFRKVLLSLFFVFCLSGFGQAQTENHTLSEPIKIIGNAQPGYTDEARKKGVDGEVVLRVTFLANGEIGEIVDITKKKRKKLLKYGLIDKAIEAAKKIKFEPQKKDGVPITVTKTISYTFTIY